MWSRPTTWMPATPHDANTNASTQQQSDGCGLAQSQVKPARDQWSNSITLKNKMLIFYKSSICQGQKGTYLTSFLPWPRGHNGAVVAGVTGHTLPVLPRALLFICAGKGNSMSFPAFSVKPDDGYGVGGVAVAPYESVPTFARAVTDPGRVEFVQQYWL